MDKGTTCTVQFMYEYGLDILTSHWKQYENEDEMNKEIKEWEEKAIGNRCGIFEGKYNPYDESEKED